MYWEYVTETEWDSMRSAPGLDTRDEENRRPAVYFDMDGTLAKFSTTATMEEVFSPGYFRWLAPNTGMTALAWQMWSDGYDVRILSKSTYQAIREKRDWLESHMPWLPDRNIYFVPIDGAKPEFVPGRGIGDILIDDYNPNLKEWEGVPVKCLTDINSWNPVFLNIPYDDPHTARDLLSGIAIPKAAEQWEQLQKPEEETGQEEER